MINYTMEDRLLAAGGNGDLATIKGLIEEGLDVEEVAPSILEVVCWRGHKDILDYLLSNGVGTPLSLNNGIISAITYGNIDIADRLIQTGAVLSMANLDTLFKRACQKADITTLEYVISLGADPKELATSGRRFVLRGTSNSTEEMLTYLTRYTDVSLSEARILALTAVSNNNHYGLRWLVNNKPDGYCHVDEVYDAAKRLSSYNCIKYIDSLS